jgi:hypothetical protein
VGNVSDIDDLLFVKREGRKRLVWTLGTIVLSAVITTATVSWKVRGYVAELEESNRKLYDRVVVLDKKVEDLNNALEAKLEKVGMDAHEAKSRADSALLVAQFLRGSVTKGGSQ